MGMTDAIETPENTGPETADTAAVPSAAPTCRPIAWRSTRAARSFDAEKLGRGVGIRFKGTVRNNVEEYCISEGWVRVQAGKTMDRKGNPLTLKLSGPVEAWYEDLGDNPPVAKA
jgi:hypothetical protein